MTAHVMVLAFGHGHGHTSVPHGGGGGLHMSPLIALPIFLVLAVGIGAMRFWRGRSRGGE